MVVRNVKHWKELYREGKEQLIALLVGVGGDFIYETFGAMIDAYEPPCEVELSQQIQSRYALLINIIYMTRVLI